MTTAPPVDIQEFRSAMRAAGIEDIVQPMLDLFVVEAPKGMASLTEAADTRDLEAVRRAAHSLKSAAGNLRAKDLADLLQQLENAAKDGDGALVGRLFDRVKVSYDAAMKYLSEAGSVE